MEALGRRCLAVTADVAKPEDCTRVVEEAVASLKAGYEAWLPGYMAGNA